MYAITMPKKDRNSFTITFDPTKVKRGHQAHLSGSGKHGDRRTKRLRTRSAQRRAALAE
jgi:hypothetical protein